MESVKLSGTGKIVSYSIIHEGPEAFKDQVPYVMAIIELDEGPRITAQIVDMPRMDNDDPTQDQTKSLSSVDIIPELAIGSRVTSVFRKISADGKSGIIHYGYKFKLVPNNN
jgi:uncharacterized OB-fold protein